MHNEELLKIFRDTGALLEGHFQLTSGLHSNQYFQCAKVLQYPRHCESLCGVIAGEFVQAGIDVVVAPALGGIVVGQEVGRQLGVRTIFAERKDGVMQLRRGFEIHSGERVLACEDVITTGGSIAEVIAIARNAGSRIVGAASIVDRSNGRVALPVDAGGKQYSILRMDVVAYKPDQCPLCAKGLPVMKPGSRGNA
jgi:orotate phosphoribosyltransferase